MEQVDRVLSELEFDIDALRHRYDEERRKRVREDGESQYIEVAGEFAAFDPSLEEDPVVGRSPIYEEFDVLVIGAGFAGMQTAVRLLEKGIENFRLLDTAGDFGGTWYWNRYPGAQCDIESYCYLPLLEETGYIPKEKYSYAPEIFEHCQRVATRFNLYEKALFKTRVTDVHWDEESSRWVVETQAGDVLKPRFLVQASGPVNRPKLPAIPGIKHFKGRMFHTSRWDYSYTGGDHTGRLTGLRGKRVAVIGTGATAIQAVPYLAADAEHLYVFQRTPSSVDLRRNAPTDPDWARSLKPGWQRARRENFNDVVTGKPFEVDLVADGWTDIFRNLKSTLPLGVKRDGDPEVEELLAEVADFRKMNELRDRVDATVKDPETAEKLKPWYRQFCKRPCFNDEYLEAFNRENVTLVDVSETKGVERITEEGIFTAGKLYPVDCIIFATGFEISTAPKRRVNFDIRGRGGRSLFDYWNSGLRTLHGYSAHGFPNWFFIGISQNGFSVNMTSILDDQGRHVVYVISETLRRGATCVEVSKEAEDAWVEEIRAGAAANKAFFKTCTPGYFNNEGLGDSAPSNLIGEGYPGGANAFHDLLVAWREEGSMNGLELSNPGAENDV